MDIEQHMSHICSNECWYACSEEEIIKYKYYNPLNAHRPEHIIHISSTQNWWGGEENRLILRMSLIQKWKRKQKLI
jgi:hypothetical protein